MKIKKILVLDGHPYEKSFSSGLAQIYFAAARCAGHEVKIVKLRNIKFDPILHFGYRKIQSLEEGLKKQQELLRWCEHLVVVTPVWWMNVPALLKGYFDRVFLPGFAYKYPRGNFAPQRLMKGRSVRVVYTQGGPQWAIRFLLGDSFWKALSRGVFHFVGFFPVRRTVFSNDSMLTEKKREKWREKIRKLGKKGK